MKQTPKQHYINLCDKLDRLMIKYDIRKKCIQCSKTRESCYDSCKECGKNGCKTKSLICKLWLCAEIMQSKEYKKLSEDKEWIKINKIATKHPEWMIYRKTIEQLYTPKGNIRKPLPKSYIWIRGLEKRLKGNMEEI